MVLSRPLYSTMKLSIFFEKKMRLVQIIVRSSVPDNRHAVILHQYHLPDKNITFSLHCLFLSITTETFTLIVIFDNF